MLFSCPNDLNCTSFMRPFFPANRLPYVLVSKILSLKDVEVFRAEKFGVRKFISYGSLPIFFMLIHAVIYCSGFLVYVLDLKRFYFYWDWIFYNVGNSTVVLSDSFLSSNFFIFRLFLILLIKLSFSSSPFLIFYIFLSFITVIIFISSYHLRWLSLKYKENWNHWHKSI